MPTEIVTVAGLTVMDVSVGAITVTEVLPVTAPIVAVIVVVPAATAVARPAFAPVATTVSTPVSPVDQVACRVTSPVVLLA